MKPFSSSAAGALGWVCLHSSHTVQYCCGGTGLGLFTLLPHCTVLLRGHWVGFVYTPPTLYSTVEGELGWVCLHPSHSVRYIICVYLSWACAYVQFLAFKEVWWQRLSTYGQVKFNLKSYDTVYPFNVDLSSLKMTVI